MGYCVDGAWHILVGFLAGHDEHLCLLCRLLRGYGQVCVFLLAWLHAHPYYIISTIGSQYLGHLMLVAGHIHHGGSCGAFHHIVLGNHDAVFRDECPLSLLQFSACSVSQYRNLCCTQFFEPLGLLRADGEGTEDACEYERESCVCHFPKSCLALSMAAWVRLVPLSMCATSVILSSSVSWRMWLMVCSSAFSLYT